MPSSIAISPSSFDAGETVTLTGTGFGVGQGSVLIGGVTQTIVSWSSTSIQFISVRGSQSMGSCRVDIYPSADPPPIFAAMTLGAGGQEVNAAATVGAAGTITWPAPVAVYFDASGTTHNDTSLDLNRQIIHHIDFGYATPTTPGSWTYSGQPKGEQVGMGQVVHVYETPNTYHPSDRAVDPSGNTSDVYATVVAQDPDTVFAGTATVCISTSANYTGAPSGATTQSTVPTTLASNKRYLFRMDEDFSATSIAIPHSISKWQVGKFGSGTNKPKIKVAFATKPPTTSQTELFGGVIMDCNVDRINVPFAHDVLFLRCSTWNITSASSYPVAIGTSAVSFYNTPPASTNLTDIKWPKRISVFESVLDAQSLAKNCLFIDTTQFALVGCSTANPVEHDTRYDFLNKGFLAHNSFSAVTDNTKHHIKLHSRGRVAPGDGPSTTTTPLSQLVNIADNVSSADDNNWAYSIGPQNDSITTVEVVKDVVVDRCDFTSSGSSTSQRAVQICGQRLTVRSITVHSWPAANAIAVNGQIGGLDASEKQPYYLPSGNSLINGSTVFAVDAFADPGKAGT